jgi:hypothetical protein
VTLRCSGNNWFLFASAGNQNALSSTTLATSGAITATGLITANGGLTTGSGQVLTSTGTTTLTGDTTATGLITANGGLSTTTISLSYSTIPSFTSAQIGFIGVVTISLATNVTNTEREIARTTVALPVGVWLLSFSFGFNGNFTTNIGLNNSFKQGATDVFASSTILPNANFANSAITTVSFVNNTGTYPYEVTSARYVFLAGKTSVAGQLITPTPEGFFRYVRIA